MTRAESLDRHLPDYRHREVHEITVEASADQVMRAIRELRGRDVALTRPLFALRSLPASLLRRPVRTPPPRWIWLAAIKRRAEAYG